jgi:hypothetical protein
MSADAGRREVAFAAVAYELASSAVTTPPV